jgi:cation:H+ antiporter
MAGTVAVVAAIGGSAVDAMLLLVSFALLLLGAEVFTNGTEWVGHKFDISQGATGSILAAVGTALPETMIPVIAIVGGFYLLFLGVVIYHVLAFDLNVAPH